MNTSVRFALIAMFLAFASLRTAAFPNLNATTGIYAVPTAETVNVGELTCAGDVLFMQDTTWAKRVVLFNYTTFNERVIYGLTDQLEVGAGVIVGNGTTVSINAKYRTGVTTGGFAWAVGMGLITGNTVDNGTQIYLAGTRPFTTPKDNGASFIGTVGVNYTTVENRGVLCPFVGAQWRLRTGMEVDGEFVLGSGGRGNSVISLLVRQRLGHRLTGQLGITNALGFTGTNKYYYFMGAAYTFGRSPAQAAPKANRGANRHPRCNDHC
ncbi:MAG TPA: hypothetical protein VGM23_08700 [Armatimonadota bacterium]|jgi:hypothetical protein